MRRAGLRCPSSRALLRGVSSANGGSASRRVRDHVQACTSCHAEWAAFSKLADLSRRLPPLEVASEDLEAVRTELLAVTYRPRRSVLRSIWLLWAPVAVLVVAAALWLVHERKVRTDRLVEHSTTAQAPPAVLHRGVVHPGSAAVFSLMQGQPDEVVRLRQGDITVEVERLAQHERFRVLTEDAAVEVKGTVFSVVAADDRLVAVSVSRGQVVVRVQGRPSVTLGPNERWDRSVERPPSAGSRDRTEPSQQRDLATSQLGHLRDRHLGLVHTEHPTAKTAPAQSAAETAFAEGWQALRSQHLAEAAAAFSRAVDAAGDQPLSEDAWFWLAVCQARIPRPTEARASLGTFIARFPHSPRAGEAADMLGWLLIDTGDLDGAARAFAEATRDPGVRVRRSASDGLRAVELRRRAVDDEMPRP